MSIANVTVDPEVLAREGYIEIFDQTKYGEVTLRNENGRFEVFAVRDSISGWGIPTECGKVLEFCRSSEVPEECDCIDDYFYAPPEIDHDDWTTDDGCIFRHAGKGTIVLDTRGMSDAKARRIAARVMRKNNFWPNVWHISDHGNVSVFVF